MFKFPYDTQFCSLNFGNVLEPDELVNVTTGDLPEVNFDLFKPSNEFDVKPHLVNKVSHSVCIAAILYENRLFFGRCNLRECICEIQLNFDIASSVMIRPGDLSLLFLR